MDAHVAKEEMDKIEADVDAAILAAARVAKARAKLKALKDATMPPAVAGLRPEPELQVEPVEAQDNWVRYKESKRPYREAEELEAEAKGGVP